MVKPFQQIRGNTRRRLTALACIFSVALVSLAWRYHNGTPRAWAAREAPVAFYVVDINTYDDQFTGDESDKGDSESDQDNSQAEQRLEQKQEKAVSVAQGREFQRIAGFATRTLRRHPRAAASADFQVRVAAANLELGENRTAHEFARRALARDGGRGARLDDALWIKGVAEYRLREYDAARRTLKIWSGETLRDV